jgi:hypothetical protein
MCFVFEKWYKKESGQNMIIMLQLWYNRVCPAVSAALAQVATQCTA